MLRSNLRKFQFLLQLREFLPVGVERRPAAVQLGAVQAKNLNCVAADCRCCGQRAVGVRFPMRVMVFGAGVQKAFPACVFFVRRPRIALILVTAKLRYSVGTLKNH